MKKISVIIPCYNVTHDIDYCMKSLIDQTIGFENLEVILVNDCSTDSTLGKLMKYESQYPDNIIVIPLEKNVKQGAARNIALQYATGEYLDYLDADDYMVKDAYEKLYDIARKYDTDIIEYDEIDVTDHDTAVTDTKIDEDDILLTIKNDEDIQDLLMSGIYKRGCWNKFYRREFVTEHDLKYAEGCYDEESLFTVMAIIYSQKYYRHYERLYCYYQNPAGTCYDKIKDIKRRDDNARVWFQLLNEVVERGLIDNIYEEFAVLFVENYLVRSVEFSYDRDLPLDLETINNMQSTVRCFFPDFTENKYIGTQPALQYVLPLVGVEIKEEDRLNFIRVMASVE